MEYRYYVAEQGQPTGPFTREELTARGIGRDTMVWREGMPKWEAAGSLPELADLFTTYSQGYTNPGAQQYTQAPGGFGYGYGNHQQYPEPVTNRTNWLPWAIVATVAGFLFSCIGAIFGIIAIVQANKASNFYAQGLVNEGDAANSTAKSMTIIGLIIGGIGLVSSIVIFLSGITTFMAALSAL